MSSRFHFGRALGEGLAVGLREGAPPPLPRRERWWLHILLFGLTLGTTTWVGANFAVSYRPSLFPQGPLTPEGLARLLDGALTFSLPLLSILLSHEMGHYLMCRRYGINASPPFFIPFPSLVGTMGAFIRIREPIQDKRRLFDVGVAGPLAGFVVALPILAYGILHTRPNVDQGLPPGTLIFQYPLAVSLLQRLLIGHTFTSLHVVEHPSFVAAWFGLFVTALNLLPIGQLDGGHALYAVVGRLQRKLVLPILLALGYLGMKFPGWWVWIVITLLLGIFHPPVVDEEVPLDPARKWTALLVLVTFIVCFVPAPLTELGESPAPLSQPNRGHGTLVRASQHLRPGLDPQRAVTARPLSPSPDRRAE